MPKVPVAITAFSGAALQQASLRNVSDVSTLTPGLVVNQGASGPSAPIFTIRGQVQTGERREPRTYGATATIKFKHL